MLCVGLSACALVPDYERPSLDLPADEQASANLAADQRAAMVQWWQQFEDPVLTRMIDTALASNLDIALQAARIQQARAQLGLSRAQFYPTLSGQVEASRAKASLEANPAIRASGQSRYSSSYSVAATLDYELNLFSALAGHEAAEAQLLAAAYTHDAIRLSVVGDIVANYMSLRAVQREIRITRGTIETRAEDLELAKKRYQFGAIDQLTLLQTQAILANARAQLPQLLEQESLLESSLALLVGKSPRAIMSEAEIEPAPLQEITLPEELPVLLPSTLVNRRPDIRAAEATLAASNANVGVARAQYFPTLNLTAMIGSAATSIGSLFESAAEAASVGGAIGAPILSFGRIQANIEAAKAQREQAIIMYRQAVRNAFADVRDALVGVDVTAERVRTTRNQVEDYEATLRLARERYNAGSTDLRDVLDAQRQLFSAELQLSQAIRDRFVATANLFKALGGGWSDDIEMLPTDIDVGLPDDAAAATAMEAADD